jgi:23S rRNA (cytidine1920-2'-O)/16S rRNA (cytidine1409-2'-O)-methyltransferase
VGRGGVVVDPETHARVLGRVVWWGVENGFRLKGLVVSPITGAAGNREFFVLLRRG